MPTLHLRVGEKLRTEVWPSRVPRLATALPLASVMQNWSFAPAVAAMRQLRMPVRVRVKLPLSFQLHHGIGVGANPREDEVALVGGDGSSKFIARVEVEVDSVRESPGGSFDFGDGVPDFQAGGNSQYQNGQDR